MKSILRQRREINRRATEHRRVARIEITTPPGDLVVGQLERRELKYAEGVGYPSPAVGAQRQPWDGDEKKRINAESV
jgi:hypothetical protein